jgi:hypothetical protein
MPYVKQTERDELDPLIEKLAQEVYRIAGHWSHPDVAVGQMGGRLNYCVTKLALRVLELGGKTSYSTLKSIMGDLECAKLEFYRRAVSKYEDGAVERNGDVY